MTNLQAKKQWFRSVRLRIVTTCKPPHPSFPIRSDALIYWTFRASSYSYSVASSMAWGELNHWQTLLDEANLMRYILTFAPDI